jgi:hypothetical protein
MVAQLAGVDGIGLNTVELEREDGRLVANVAID